MQVLCVNWHSMPITILVSIPLSIVVLMYICSVSSGAGRHVMLLLYFVLYCTCIQLLRNIYMKYYLPLYAFCYEFFSCRSDWIPSLCQPLPQVEIDIEGCLQFRFLSGEMLLHPACCHRQALQFRLSSGNRVAIRCSPLPSRSVSGDVPTSKLLTRDTLPTRSLTEDTLPSRLVLGDALPFKLLTRDALPTRLLAGDALPTRLIAGDTQITIRRHSDHY